MCFWVWERGGGDGVKRNAALFVGIKKCFAVSSFFSPLHCSCQHLADQALIKRQSLHLLLRLLCGFCPDLCTPPQPLITPHFAIHCWGFMCQALIQQEQRLFMLRWWCFQSRGKIYVDTLTLLPTWWGYIVECLSRFMRFWLVKTQLFVIGGWLEQTEFLNF